MINYLMRLFRVFDLVLLNCFSGVVWLRLKINRSHEGLLEVHGAIVNYSWVPHFCIFFLNNRHLVGWNIYLVYLIVDLIRGEKMMLSIVIDGSVRGEVGRHLTVLFIVLVS